MELHFTISLCLFLLYVEDVSGIVGGQPASPPEPDAAVVFVQKRGRSARVEGVKHDSDSLYSFYGIRYAQPPMGRRRFQRPIRQYLSGEQMAVKSCRACPQPHPSQQGEVIGHEDCLCLNVFAPKMPGEENGCPVVIFIHGGNYRIGSAHPYGGELFAKKDVIVVVPQYRLGSLGYLSTNTTDASGNLGLIDMVAAMAWVQDYIEFFGGDPKRVTLMGQGSGASAASVLSVTRAGRDVTGVAALSGTPLSAGAVRSDPAAHAAAVARRTACPPAPAERLVKCLRQMPAEKIVLADNDLNVNGMDTMQFLQDISGRSGAGARVEGEPDLRSKPPVVEEKPATALKRKVKRPPLLTGVVAEETGRAVFGRYSKFLTDQLEQVSDFIKKDLLGGLQGVVGGVDGLLPGPAGDAVRGVSGALPLADYYQTLFDTSKAVVGGLTQVAEATGDALFNFPAFATVKAWGGGGEGAGGAAFLYSFEHAGNLSKGWHFLPGMSLTDPSADGTGQIQKPTHGDELAYLFLPHDHEGKPMEEPLMSDTDSKVRNSFVELVSKFAHGTKDETKDGGLGGLVKGLLPFSGQNDQFLKINDGGISLDKDFRFCQMGIWGNMGDRLKQTVCTELIANLLTKALPIGELPTLPGNGKLPIDKVPLDKVPLDKVPLDKVVGNEGLQNAGGIVPGLFGGGNMKPKPTMPPRRQMTTKKTTSRNNLLPFDF